MGRYWSWAVVLLCLFSKGICSSPGDGSSRRDWSQLAVSGSRYAPGIAMSGPWGYFGSRDGPLLRPVAIQCGQTNMVVNVQRDLFGTGKLIQAADLRIGAALCKYTSLNSDNTITFQMALQDCGNTLQITSDSLVYNSILSYNPTPSMNSRVIVRTNPASVPIQCIYPRNGNVSSNAIKPTWIPFSSTVNAQGSLLFSLRLMSDDWTSARSSTNFQLGDVFNIEASVQTGNHVPMRIFVDSCVATLSPDARSSPRYDLITASGCLVDGKLLDSSSTFVSPRPQTDTLQLMIDAFRFIGDARSLIYITCSLKAVPLSKDPDSMNKACYYSKTLNGWVPVEGQNNICSCCDSGFCFALRKKRSVPLLASTVQTAMIGPLTILQPDILMQQVDIQRSNGDALGNQHGAAEEHWMVLGLVLAASAVLILFVVLALVLYKRFGASDSSVNAICK